MYAYDNANRLTKRSIYNMAGTAQDIPETPDMADRMYRYTYDRQGNMLSDGDNTYRYDGMNRLKEINTKAGDIQKNRYDGEGLRAELEENERLVSFLYSDGEAVLEDSAAAGITRYIRGLGILTSDSESARTYYHYESDELGSITHITDSEGNVLNRYEYDVFGNFAVKEETIPNRFGFTGEQYDPVTSQYYLRARFYNPVIGRFLNEDTYYGDGLNLYTYCQNNPVEYVDPSGHDGICPKKYKQYREEGYSAVEAGIKAKYDKILREEGKSKARKYKRDAVKKLKKKKYEFSDTWNNQNKLPDWLQKRFDAGNEFNRQNRKRYKYNEVEVYGKGKKYVVDSYTRGKEIVSRKYTQLANVKESTGKGYLNELAKKYPSGAIITDSPFNPKTLRGEVMTGDLILEVPVQNKPVPQSVIDYAKQKNITIRDVEGKEYK